MTELTDEVLAAMKKKYFPRIPWTENGPVRRVFYTRAEQDNVFEVLTRLAESYGFTETGKKTVTGNASDAFSAFYAKAHGEAVGMIFGNELNAYWCDLAVGSPDAEGWRKLVIRSEEGENLIALAHNEELLSFRRPDSL